MTTSHPKAMLAALLGHPSLHPVRDRYAINALSFGIGNGAPVLHGIGSEEVILSIANVSGASGFWDRIATIADLTEKMLTPCKVWHARLIASHMSDGREVGDLTPPPVQDILDIFSRFAWEDAERRAGSDDHTFVDFEFSYDDIDGRPRTTRINAFGGPSVGGEAVRIEPGSRAAIDLADWVAAAWPWLDGFERLRFSYKPDRPSGHLAMKAAAPPGIGRTPPAGFIIRSDNGLRIEPIPTTA